MQIIIDTAGLDQLTALERSVLELLLGKEPAKPAPAKEAAQEPQEQPKEKAPAKKSRAKKSAPESDPEPSEQSEAVDKAVSVARGLIRDGNAAAVSAALQSAGAERVSVLTPEQAEKFLEEVSA